MVGYSRQIITCKSEKKKKKRRRKTDNIGVHRERKHCSGSEIFFSTHNRKLSILTYIEIGIVANQIDQACKDPYENVRQRWRNNSRGVLKALRYTYSLPAINNAVNVEHGNNLEDKSFPKMTGSVEVTH